MTSCRVIDVTSVGVCSYYCVSDLCRCGAAEENGYFSSCSEAIKDIKAVKDLVNKVIGLSGETLCSFSNCDSSVRPKVLYY